MYEKIRQKIIEIDKHVILIEDTVNIRQPCVNGKENTI
jgi:hypothetical protein